MSAYYIHDNGVTVGPIGYETVVKFIKSGRLNATSPVRKDNDGWTTLIKIPEFCDYISEVDDNKISDATIIGEINGILKFACPYCSRHYEGEGYRGHRIHCGECHRTFIVPDGDGSVSKTIPVPDSFDADLANEIPDGEIVCPHCWKSFPVDRLLYISCHPSLIGDHIAGEMEQSRFLPTKFNAMGQPLDDRGLVCTDMACPRCHLRIPSTVADLPSLCFSIVGAPSSGKSYYLTSLIHSLRRTLGECFSSSLLDADPLLNSIIDGYERAIFMPADRDSVAVLPKTQQTGRDFSNQILLDGLVMDLPKPFIFELRPFATSEALHRNCNLIFYDNAGEHFQPGTDVLVNPATHHLAKSRGIIFLFDPTNDAMMRQICNRDDPQMDDASKVSDQSVLLAEMINRIRRHRNISASEMVNIPLVIAVAKYDAWREHLPWDLAGASTIVDGDGSESQLNLGILQQVSFLLRQLMLEQAPAVVGVAEAFFRHVWFVPVSNFGCLARRNENGYIGIVPAELKPIWVDEPFLLLLYELGLISGISPDRSDCVSDFACQMSGEMILFRNPSTGKRVLLPSNYLGAVLKIGANRYALLPAEKASSRVAEL